MAGPKYPRWGWPQLLLANCVIVAVYLITVRAGALLVLPTGYPNPVFPPSGVNLALTVIAGWRVLPGVAAGPISAYLLFGTWPLLGGSHDNAGLFVVTALTIKCTGLVLQSWVGAMLFRRWIDPAIDSVRDVLCFLLLGPLTCLVNPSVNVASAGLLGLIHRDMLVELWLSWWAGDTIGVLLAAPLTWIVFGVPRPLWRRRAGLVALPLLLAAGAVVATYEQAVKWEAEQRVHAFRLKAQQAADLIQARFNEHTRFVETFASALANVGPDLRFDKFLRIAGTYARACPELQGVVWAVRVDGADRARFEAWGRRYVAPDFEIREIGPDGKMRPAGPRAVYFPLLYTTSEDNVPAMGLDALSDPERAKALTRALQSNEPAATGPLRLVVNGRNGIALFHTVGVPRGGAPGVVILVIDGGRLINLAANQADFNGYRVEMIDVTDPRSPRPLFDNLEGPDVYRMGLHLDQRRYQLRIAPATPYPVRQHGWASWLVLTSGLMLTGLLGALMMLISGEQARTEALVAERTSRLRNREARLEAILDNAADAIMTVDSHGNVVSANAATAALFGYPPDELRCMPFIALVPGEAEESGPALLGRLAHAPAEERELMGMKADGESFPVAISVARVLLPAEHLFVCMLRDLSEQYRSQERIYKLAHYDALTGLENRYALRERLEEQLAHARRAGEPLAVLFIDLDYFKKINDSYGHHVGDLLLVSASARMRDLLRDVDILARLGGDEFVIVLTGPLTPDSVRAIAVRLVQSLTGPYEMAGNTVHSGASVGVALFPDDGTDGGTLLRHADTAMYAAKREGRGNFQFFSPAMNAVTHENLLLENRMWTALEKGQFQLHLQAQVQLDTGRVIGAEVLLRWEDPELGKIEPSRFIPIAEESGLILPLGDWVLSRTMQMLAEWKQQGFPQLRLAVNLSARQFSGSALLGRLDQLLVQYRIDPSCLELEITETAAMRDPENTRHLLRELRARGFTLAIDDFGTGYSSLAYLKLFAIDRIKIDRGFVKDIETNQNDASIVAATIGLAHSLGLSVIAEGVETHAQWGFLRDKHGDEAQGYLFGVPMPAREFLESIRHQAQPVPGS